MRVPAILAFIIGLYATGCAAAPLEPARQAADLSWVHSSTILYTLAGAGIIAIPLDTGEPSLLIPNVGWGGETLLLSPDQTRLLYGRQATGFWLVYLKTHVQLDLAKFMPAKSLVQVSPDWSLLAWTNPYSGRVGVIDLAKLTNAEFTLPTGLPAQDTVINSIGWSYDGSRILVDSESSVTARRVVYVRPSDGDAQAEFDYAPSQASLTGAEFSASLKEQYWALDPKTGLAESVTADLLPIKTGTGSAWYPYEYAGQPLHFFRKGQEIGVNLNFVWAGLSGLRTHLPEISLSNGARISTDEFGGLYLIEPNGQKRLIQAPLPSSYKTPPSLREPTGLWAVFDDNYVMYGFDHKFWLYGIRENIRAPFFTPSRANFSNRFQP
jgi:hypothetical protein